MQGPLNRDSKRKAMELASSCVVFTPSTVVAVITVPFCAMYRITEG